MEFQQKNYYSQHINIGIAFGKVSILNIEYL